MTRFCDVIKYEVTIWHFDSFFHLKCSRQRSMAVCKVWYKNMINFRVPWYPTILPCDFMKTCWTENPNSASMWLKLPLKSHKIYVIKEFEVSCVNGAILNEFLPFKVAPYSSMIAYALRTKAQVICLRSNENVSVFRYFSTSTWAKKAKLRGNFLVFPSVKFRET